MKRKYRYDAFISYRHTELDKFVAERLHKELEAFSLPGSVAKKRKGQKNKIERVFRDKDELPLASNLEDPIIQALQNSEWLIVICSPRLRESLWCKKEIETFIELRGREHVLAVLIEGEPAESFPEELLYRTMKRTLADGTEEEVRIPVEPLAADVRGKNKKEMLKAMKTEILRLLAAMFELPYDDLRQRHRERKMRRIVTASLIGAVACLLFGIYSTATALRIQRQKEQIEAQSEQLKQQSQEILEQSDEIKKQSQEILQKNEEITAQNQELALRQARFLAELATNRLEDGDRSSAVDIAVEALTESDGIVLPYTPEAEYILTESLRVYDTGNTYKAEYQYETAGKISYVLESPDSDTLLLYDDTQTLTLFDVANAEVIDTINAEEYDYQSKGGCAFLGNDKFVYINVEDEICIYDLAQKKVTDKLQPKRASKLVVDQQGKYIAVKQWYDTYIIYDAETLQELGETPKLGEGISIGGPFLSSEGIYANAYSLSDDYTNQEYELVFLDMKTMEVMSTCYIGAKDLEEILIRDGIAYVLAGEYEDGYTGCDTYTFAVDTATGRILWENVCQGQWPDILRLPINEGATDLISITTDSFSYINMESGELSFIQSISAPVVEANVYLNYNNYLLFCENGQMLVADKEYKGYLDLSYKFECRTQYNQHIYQSAYGITALEYNDNKITIYTNKMGPEVVETEVERTLPEEDILIRGDEAAEIAKGYGLEKPEFIQYLYYGNDEKYCFVRYWDESFLIYDTQQGKVLNTLEETYPTNWYLGTDAQGYTYLLGYYGCYKLNQDMQPVQWLDCAHDIDMEAKKVYLEWNGHHYEAPLYSVEELLEMVK